MILKQLILKRTTRTTLKSASDTGWAACCFLATENTGITEAGDRAEALSATANPLRVHCCIFGDQPPRVIAQLIRQRFKAQPW
ncbi:hypothetical protein RB1362 [Rhodopirellula baltica SH 1]|uniref:Uncharacterized protein n=1 Tax=Rhodopirellula baltica (strain DSM 10527 / NCIMB 13988 / SH1) TaxID=243090 RepID=Q7UXF2_RHOBA|nr:hypothetical protein RB1362 [Rhodopirellula baltica SH 1]